MPTSEVNRYRNTLGGGVGRLFVHFLYKQCGGYQWGLEDVTRPRCKPHFIRIDHSIVNTKVKYTCSGYAVFRERRSRYRHLYLIDRSHLLSAQGLCGRYKAMKRSGICRFSYIVANSFTFSLWFVFELQGCEEKLDLTTPIKTLPLYIRIYQCSNLKADLPSFKH